MYQPSETAKKDSSELGFVFLLPYISLDTEKVIIFRSNSFPRLPYEIYVVQKGGM